jgi:hypothetical protein
VEGARPARHPRGNPPGRQRRGGAGCRRPTTSPRIRS